MTLLPKLEIYSDGGEWSALYVDGKLEVVGDTYLSEERVMKICGVVQHQDNRDWIGPDGSRESVAASTDEIEDRRIRRERREEEAEALEEQAKGLLAQAKVLRSGGVKP